MVCISLEKPGTYGELQAGEGLWVVHTEGNSLGNSTLEVEEEGTYKTEIWKKG